MNARCLHVQCVVLAASSSKQNTVKTVHKTSWGFSWLIWTSYYQMATIDGSISLLYILHVLNRSCRTIPMHFFTSQSNAERPRVISKRWCSMWRTACVGSFKAQTEFRNQLDDWWPANGCNIRLKGNNIACDNTVFAVTDCTQQHLSFMSICLHGHSLLYHVLCFVVACGSTSPTINEHVHSTYKLLSRKKRNHRMTMATYKLQTFISSFIRKLEIFVCIFCIYDWCNKHSARSIHAPSSS